MPRHRTWVGVGGASIVPARDAFDAAANSCIGLPAWGGILFVESPSIKSSDTVELVVERTAFISWGWAARRCCDGAAAAWPWSIIANGEALTSASLPTDEVERAVGRSTAKVLRGRFDRAYWLLSGDRTVRIIGQREHRSHRWQVSNNTLSNTFILKCVNWYHKVQ